MDTFDGWGSLRGPIPSVVDRYYTKFYAIDVKGRENEDHCILQHSNRVMIVCLAETHPLIKDQSSNEVREIEFQIGKVDRSDNPVSGRFKKGGQKLTATSPIAIVHTKDNKKYVLYSCLKGMLVEINDQLLKEPQLLQIEPQGRGYIAILLPNKLNEASTVTESLLSEESYKTLRQIK
ncbi:PREDICTED: protein Simiate-like [Amphimedon queenslandica]|uniref:Protein Abitram n=1 Tax=Amphimedon queenslandica TaxID=400682 RepID=A0A1X7VV63_AMPQE|nr:PREDICTED: protein Simiate-like [Amphimedon queenslandica]|eukprot:XP_003382730.1 PREDICTED: protein Simiate-like [Amphimedon queenslandica]